MLTQPELEGAVEPPQPHDAAMQRHTVQMVHPPRAASAAPFFAQMA